MGQDGGSGSVTDAATCMHGQPLPHLAFFWRVFWIGHNGRGILSRIMCPHPASGRWRNVQMDLSGSGILLGRGGG